MYIRKIHVENYGPIHNIDYALPFDKSGKPMPVILVGQNGTGKTLLLSVILQALIELKRNFYRELAEVHQNNLYSVSSFQYITVGTDFAYYRLDFDEAYYMSMIAQNYDTVKNIYSPEKYPDLDINNYSLKETGFYYNVNPLKQNVFEHDIFLYFPAGRYYIPSWINANNKRLSFINDKANYVGIDDYGIVQYNILENLEAWLLDVVIDQLLYEQQSVTVGIEQNGQIIEQLPLTGRNTDIHYAINEVISKLFVRKGCASARFAISRKRYRTISIIGRKDDEEYYIAPSFSNLSSGEVMLLGIFAAIIRTYDTVCSDEQADYSSASGIVLIDEIDAHLHSDLLKDVLPALIKMFPRIQFIISSHSPFFLLGMQEEFGETCRFVAMPTASELGSIENFDEVRNCYSIVDDSYQSILEAKERYELQLKNITRPLIITEGKTDWKHLKRALEKLQVQGEFTELDVQFLEYDDDLGDSKLESLLNYAARLPNNHTIIGVFDNDTAKGKRYSEITPLGNNVYACCITDTLGYGCEISIELLYRREDLMIQDENNRRLYLSDEFTEGNHRLKQDPSINCTNKTLENAHERKIVKVVDSGIWSSDGQSLALSKEQFASYILDGHECYKNVSAEGFRDIFTKIASIVTKGS